MKRYTLIILAAVLSMLGIQTASAQAAQDALYIFRNDGGFNAFFFADIDRIEYSKIDTLGVEQADYVVQEVYALDSVFRIPISAIDSVAFVTPETKYKEGVIKIEENLRNFVTAFDSLTLTLAANTPENIVPKVGDKLTMLEVNDIFPYGFAGVVAKVENNGDGYTVTCEAAALTELFERLVIKGGVESGTDLAQSRKMNRALIDKDFVKTVDLDAYTFNFALTESLGFGPFSADVSATASGSYQLQFTHRFYLYVGSLLEGNYYSTFTRLQHTKEFALNFAGSLTTHVNIPIVFIPVPLGQPFFRLDLSAGVFLEGQGSINTGFKITDVSSQVDHTRYSYNVFDGEYSVPGSPEPPKTIRHDESWQKLSGKVQLGAGIYADVALVALVKDVANISITADAGARLEIESELKQEDFDVLTYWEPDPSDVTKLYGLLDRDVSVKKSFVRGIQCTVKGGIVSTTGRTEFVVGLPETGALVPHFSNARVEPDPNGNNSMAKYSVDISGNTFSPHKIGFICYDEDGWAVDEDALDDPYENGKPNTMTIWIKKLKPGQKYTVYPQTEIDNPFGTAKYDILGNPALTFTGFRSVADLEVFTEGTEYYNSEYNLSFNDYNQGHSIALYKYDPSSGNSSNCFGGYYTADGNKMEISLNRVPSKVGGQENPFYALGLREGDVIIITYNKTDEGITLNIAGMSISLQNPINIDGIWRTTDGLAEFDLDGYWGWYRCFDQDTEHDGEHAMWRLYLMLGRSMNQFVKTIRFRVSYAYDTTTERKTSVNVMLPTQDKVTVECKDYTVPFKLETKDGVELLSFELFGYPFVLQKIADK